jgi:hypothetical protein
MIKTAKNCILVLRICFWEYLELFKFFSGLIPGLELVTVPVGFEATAVRRKRPEFKPID